MREIKFRVWDEYHRCFLRENGSYLKDIYHVFDCHFIPKPEYRIMQFTGLHDKNGREIYEGDIVCITDYHDGDFYMNGVVRFGFNGYPAFEIYGRKNQTYSDEYNSMTNDDLSLEVIGNIHENTGLLDGLK